MRSSPVAALTAARVALCWNINLAATSFPSRSKSAIFSALMSGDWRRKILAFRPPGYCAENILAGFSISPRLILIGRDRGRAPAARPPRHPRQPRTSSKQPPVHFRGDLPGGLYILGRLFPACIFSVKRIQIMYISGIIPIIRVIGNTWSSPCGR